MKTIYEVSWLNPIVLFPLTALGFGIYLFVAAVFRIGNVRFTTGIGRTMGLTMLIGWIGFWSWLGATYVREGEEFTTALRESKCEVVEGTVEVLRAGRRGGHDDGDRIRIATNEFWFTGTPEIGYHHIAANGGVLTNGAHARLHFLNNAILKVEVRQ